MRAPSVATECCRDCGREFPADEMYALVVTRTDSHVRCTEESYLCEYCVPACWHRSSPAHPLCGLPTRRDSGLCLEHDIEGLRWCIERYRAKGDDVSEEEAELAEALAELRAAERGVTA